MFDALSGALAYRKPFPHASEGAVEGIAGGGDWLAFFAGKNDLTCLRIPDGMPAWHTRLPQADHRRMSVQEEILHLPGLRGMISLDIRTGRVMDRDIEDRRRTTVFSALILGGLILTAYSDDTATICDVRRRTGERTRSLPFQGGEWRLLGAGKQFLFLRHDDGRVQALDLADPAKRIPLNVNGPTGGERPTFLDFALCGERALVLYNQPGKGGLSTPILTAFDLPAGTIAWKRDLAVEHIGPCRAGRIEVFGGAAATAIEFPEVGTGSRLLLMDAVEGKIFDCGTALGGQFRISKPRTPVVMNGRVIVEHDSGLACLTCAE